MRGVGRGGGGVQWLCRGKLHRPRFQQHVSLGISLTSRPSARACCVFLSPSPPKFFRSCLTLLTTHRRVVQPVQIRRELPPPRCPRWASSTLASHLPKVSTRRYETLRVRQDGEVGWEEEEEEEMEAKQAERRRKRGSQRRSPSGETQRGLGKALFDGSFYPSIFEEFIH